MAHTAGMHKPNCFADLKTCKTSKLLPQTQELTRVLIHKLLITNRNFVIQEGVTRKHDSLKVLMPRRGPSWIQGYSTTQKITGLHRTFNF